MMLKKKRKKRKKKKKRKGRRKGRRKKKKKKVEMRCCFAPQITIKASRPADAIPSVFHSVVSLETEPLDSYEWSVRAAQGRPYLFSLRGGLLPSFLFKNLLSLWYVPLPGFDVGK